MVDKKPKEYFTVGEVAEMFSITKKTVKRWDADGRFPNSIGEDRGRRYHTSDIEAIRNKTDAVPRNKSDNPEIKRVEDEALIAASENKRVEYEIKTKLMHQGVESIEAGLKHVETRKQEADRLFNEASECMREALKTKDEAEEQKQKVLGAFQVVKQREATVNIRLEKAVKIEDEYKNQDKRYSTIKKELDELVEYHKENIEPCLKSLKAVAKAIYNWMDVLNTETNYDFSQLYNYILQVTNAIDKYLEKERITANIGEVQESKVKVLESQ